MKKIRTAVIGMGRIGWQYHAPRVSEHEGFELVAVCDPVAERLQESRERYSVPGYAGLSELLSEQEPELVVIASPTNYHEQQAIAAMEAGSDVFLDKPMAADLRGADAIIAAKERTGRKLMMFQPMRLSPDTAKLKDILDSGIIGETFMIKHAEGRFVFRDDWQAFRKYGGGMLNNSGAHMVDAMLYLAGGSAKRVNCHLHRILSVGDADDVVKIVLGMENGITVDIDINHASAVEHSSWTAFGSLGTVTMHTDEHWKRTFCAKVYDPAECAGIVADDGMAARNRKYINNGPKNWKTHEYPVDNESGENFYNKCYAYFALGEEPFVRVEDTREVMRILGECRRDAGWEE